jgi:hypothetical protein
MSERCSAANEDNAVSHDDVSSDFPRRAIGVPATLVALLPPTDTSQQPSASTDEERFEAEALHFIFSPLAFPSIDQLGCSIRAGQRPRATRPEDRQGELEAKLLLQLAEHPIRLERLNRLALALLDARQVRRILPPVQLDLFGPFVPERREIVRG